MMQSATARNMVCAMALLLAALLSAAPCGAGEKAGTGWKEGIAARKGKAKTVAELVAMYDSSSCVECHREIHEDWLKSIHSRSIFGTGRTAATIVTAIQNGLMEWESAGVREPGDVRVEHLMICAKCHLPQLADAQDSVAAEIARDVFRWQDAAEDNDAVGAARVAEKLKSLNINCLVCHNRNAITHKWSDGFPRAGVVYGGKDGSHDAKDFPLAKKSPVMGEAIFCGQCHGLGPNMDLEQPTQCATLYGSYLWHYQAEGGQATCQECHMRRSGLGHNMQSYRDVGMARAAVDFAVETRGMLWRNGSTYIPKVVVIVSLTNRTGHAVPDG